MARKLRGMPCERGWGSLGEHPSTQHSNPHTSLFSLHVFDTMSHVPSFPLTYIATQGPACDHSPVCSQWGPAQEASKASHLGCGDTVPIPFTHDPSVCTCATRVRCARRERTAGTRALGYRAGRRGAGGGEGGIVRTHEHDGVPTP